MPKQMLHMLKYCLLAAWLAAPLAVGCRSENQPGKEETMITLPKPKLKSDCSLEEAIQSRRSVRSYAKDSLALNELGQLLWAAQGITDSGRQLRSAPSAGATYPLHLYAVVDKVEGLEPGLYLYHPEQHAISLVQAGDIKAAIGKQAARQSAIQQAPLTLAFCAQLSRISPRYGDRSERYTYLEIGHAAENVHLQCESLGLGTVCVGSFDDAALKAALGLPPGVDPHYLMPVGKKP